MKEHLKTEHLPKCGLRFFLPAGDNDDITKRFEFGPDRFPPHPNYQIDRGLFENELATRARGLGVDVLQGLPGPGRELRRRPSRGLLHPDGRRCVDQGPLGGRRRRAGQPAEAQARPGQGGRPHHQLGLVSARRGARHRGLRPRQRRVDGQDVRARHPQVQHQPSAGRGLLDLADPALHGADLDRGVRRPALPSVRGDLGARADGGVARAPRAPTGGCRRAAPRPGRGLPARRGLRLRRRAGVLARALVPGGRGRRLRRPLLLAGLGHDRLRQHLHRGPDHARPRRRGRGRAARVLERLLPAHLRLRALEVRGPVPGLRQRLGRRAEERLGQVLRPRRRCASDGQGEVRRLRVHEERRRGRGPALPAQHQHAEAVPRMARARAAARLEPRARGGGPGDAARLLPGHRAGVRRRAATGGDAQAGEGRGGVGGRPVRPGRRQRAGTASRSRAPHQSLRRRAAAGALGGGPL